MIGAMDKEGVHLKKGRSRSPAREHIGLWDLDENDAEGSTTAWRNSGDTAGAWRNAGHKMDEDRAAQEQQRETSE